jgi:putative transcriptional regulator
VQSLKEARAISQGEATASRRFEVTPPDAKAGREQIGLSQSEFASLRQVNVKTRQNGEQHRRHPTGPGCCALEAHLLRARTGDQVSAPLIDCSGLAPTVFTSTGVASSSHRIDRLPHPGATWGG